MNGSQFERANIVAEELSATVASKTTDRGIEKHTYRPSAVGLYDPALEKDSCGVGFIANIKGRKSHSIVEQGLTILKNLNHRGAVGAEMP